MKISINLIKFLSGIVITFLGNELFKFMIDFWVVSETSSTKEIAKITMISLIPLLFINLISGIVVDKFKRKKIIVISDIISGISCLITYFYLDNRFEILALAILLIILKITDSFFSIASRGIVPLMFEKESLVKVNSYYTIARNLVSIIAPIIGNILVLSFNPSLILLINGISFILTAIVEMFWNIKNINSKHIEKNNYIKTIKIIMKNKTVFKMLINATLANFFLAGYPILLSYVIIVEKNNKSMYGLTLSMMAFGAILASIVINIDKIKHIFLDGIGFLFLISFVFIFSIGNELVIMFCAFLYSFLLNLFNIKFFSKVQAEMDVSILGQLFAIVFTMAGVAMPFGNLMIENFDKLFGSYSISVLGILFLISLSIFNAIYEVMIRIKSN
ncbi:MAG: hypothetical protein PWP46_1777 [Fusobacteriaceae bacterium]|jgi:MFS family permease|nr:major facilitator superfamily 1 [Fusobacteriales bacterium]MDN5304891.1 hypothetical protein [Fusobacteriaceae bacterium]